MRTQVSLDAVTPLVNGYHENPFEVLGPHEIIGDGQRATAVRAFLPGTQQAWVVDAPMAGGDRCGEFTRQGYTKRFAQRKMATRKA